MASPLTAALCATVATAYWMLLGYALCGYLLPRALAIGAAAVIGWAVFNAITPPIFAGVGFSRIAVIVVAALGAVLAGVALRRPTAETVPLAPSLPPYALCAAALLAVVPAAAIVPKTSGDAVFVAAPIFDHAKIAIIDAITRQGLPPVNPVFGAGTGQLAYYYLWHFSAAALGLPLRASGWEADIGLTWFTAFASLSLMMGLAVWLSKRPAAALWVVVFAAAASLRGALSLVFDSYGLEPFLASPNGFAGWLFQSAWVPQHLMSASCVVAALLLIAEYRGSKGSSSLSRRPWWSSPDSKARPMSAA